MLRLSVPDEKQARHPPGDKRGATESRGRAARTPDERTLYHAAAELSFPTGSLYSYTWLVPPERGGARPTAPTRAQKMLRDDLIGLAAGAGVAVAILWEGRRRAHRACELGEPCEGTLCEPCDAGADAAPSSPPNAAAAATAKRVNAASQQVVTPSGSEGTPTPRRALIDASEEVVRDLRTLPSFCGLSKDSKATARRDNYLGWHDYFMSVAMLSAFRSKDPNRQVGACIVDPKTQRIVGIGYNGFPWGCSDDALPWSRDESLPWIETKYPYVCHAEMNAIMNKNISSTEGCRIYTTLFPCNDCAKLIVQSRMTEVVYLSDEKAKPAFVSSAHRGLPRPACTHLRPPRPVTRQPPLRPWVSRTRAGPHAASCPVAATAVALASHPACPPITPLRAASPPPPVLAQVAARHLLRLAGVTLTKHTPSVSRIVVDFADELAQ